jgi:hypothetical protein
MGKKKSVNKNIRLESVCTRLFQIQEDFEQSRIESDKRFTLLCEALEETMFDLEHILETE